MAKTNTIGVIGSGKMGLEIAQLAALHGIDVWLMDNLHLHSASCFEKAILLQLRAMMI